MWKRVFHWLLRSNTANETWGEVKTFETKSKITRKSSASLISAALHHFYFF